MKNKIEKEIQLFVEGIGGIVRQEIVHGTLYLKLDYDNACDNVHQAIRTFYKENINPDGGVNMYFVGDEFAFDFVPAESEIPLYEGEKIRDEVVDLEKLTDDITEGAMKEQSDVDIALNLEIEQLRGK